MNLRSPVHSYRLEVQWTRDDHETLWTGDARRFATLEEAQAYGEYLTRTVRDLARYRVLPSALDPNARWIF